MTLTNVSALSDSVVLFSDDDEESDSYYESKQYENFTEMLKGVPPPSSITISKFTVEEMLEKYHANQEAFGFGLHLGNTKFSITKTPVPFFKYLNSSQISENIASLAQKVQERYIQMETMSSCNIWFMETLATCGSAKKRLRSRQSMGMSPGRRLSHLARRRQLFSRANLQRLANAENIRQIAIKKNDDQGEVRKSIGRSVEPEKLKSSKRALFMSPDSGTPTKYGNRVSVERKIYSSGSDERRKLPLHERSKTDEVLDWLSQQKFEGCFPRKRLREECAKHSNERMRKCPRRSLNFADDDSSSTAATSDSSLPKEKNISVTSKLSQIHKNKLLWATSVGLKEYNMTKKNEHFKRLACKLFSRCRENLGEILNLKIPGGTSDKILHYARQIIPSIFEELGIKLPPKDNTESVNNKSDESKENINSNNQEQPANREIDEFVFKTPMKVRGKRIVKSCQKAPNSGNRRKRTNMKRWRSLELLIEDAVIEDLKNNETVLEKSCVGDDSEANETAQSNSEICTNNADSNALIENKNTFCVPASAIPVLPSVDTSIIFSPIPSSVHEASSSISYPSLSISQIKVEESEGISDENDSIEILNVEEDLGKRIELLGKEGMFPDIQKETFADVEDTIPLSPIEHPEITNEIPEATNTSLVLNETHNDTRTEESFNSTGVSQCSEDHSDEDEQEERLTQECISKATYKPRKLVVKKSKPNWKVVRKNSDEAENESELRLKMRLSHEWEVICRNSSCSDIGNNSEYETTSVNCSQISSATDKDISSENEVDSASRRSSKYDESMDEELPKINDTLRIDESNQIFNSDTVGREDDLPKRKLTLIPTVSTHNDDVIQLDEVGEYVGQSCDKTADDSNFNVEVDEGQKGLIPQENKNIGEEICEMNVVTSDEQETIRSVIASSPVLSIKRNSGENFPNINVKSSPNVKRKGDAYLACERNRELEGVQDDSESGKSSSPNSSERKKRSLSLENYKARRLEEAQFKVSHDESDTKSDEKTSKRKKKIYNIRLKHPIGYRKHKHKYHSREETRRRKHESVQRQEPDPESPEPESGESSGSGSHMHSIRQFLDSFCEVENKKEQSSEVGVQAIVDALSSLSNLVQEQIKLENDKMASKSEEDGLKQSKWLNVVGSWCRKNLNNLTQTANASSFSMEGLDDGSAAAMKKVLSFNRNDPRNTNILKTEVKDCLKPETTNLTVYNNVNMAVNYPTNSGNNCFYNKMNNPNDPRYMLRPENGYYTTANGMYSNFFTNTPQCVQADTYSAYQNWQIPGNMGTWNFHYQNYQNQSFYPMQMQNVPYYFN